MASELSIRIPAPLEAFNARVRPGVADPGFILLSGSGLGYCHKHHHGDICLPYRSLEHAGAPRNEMVFIPLHALLYLVYRGRMLRPLLAFHEPGSTRTHAQGKLSSFVIALWNMRHRLVISWEPQTIHFESSFFLPFYQEQIIIKNRTVPFLLFCPFLKKGMGRSKHLSQPKKS
jgi:hypothetical protein